jgi:hypothetical protein
MTASPPTGLEWQALEAAKAFQPAACHDLVAAAQARIPELRMRSVRMRATDRAGRPLAHRTIRVAQQRSAFAWGFPGGRLVELMTRPDEARIMERRRPLLQLAELFNSVNLLNYWQESAWASTPPGEELLGYPTYEPLDLAVQWARGHGLTPKIHPLWWGVPKAVPAWMARYTQAQRAMFREVRLRQIAGRFRGRVPVYDAVNEAIWEPPLAGTAQRVWPHLTPIPELAADIAEVLRIVRDEDPAATLVVNDYGVQVGQTEPIPVTCNDGTRTSRRRRMICSPARACRSTSRNSNPAAPWPRPWPRPARPGRRSWTASPSIRMPV